MPRRSHTSPDPKGTLPRITLPAAAFATYLLAASGGGLVVSGLVTAAHDLLGGTPTPRKAFIALFTAGVPFLATPSTVR